MTAKPCFGHKSRTDAVLAFRAEGLTTAQIADKLAVAHKTVTALEHSALRSTKRAARPAEQHGRTILFARDLLDRLGPHAARRGVHPNSLARLIVETVVDEGLVDSVLDDMDELENGGME
jgi:transcriptional regulator